MLLYYAAFTKTQKYTMYAIRCEQCVRVLSQLRQCRVNFQLAGDSYCEDLLARTGIFQECMTRSRMLVPVYALQCWKPGVEDAEDLATHVHVNLDVAKGLVCFGVEHAGHVDQVVP